MIASTLHVMARVLAGHFHAGIIRGAFPWFLDAS
jgi:hypothetical protein